MSVEIRPAAEADLPEIEQLLEDSGLPLAGVAEALEQFLVARDGGRLAGVIGLERYGPVALLRSAAVDPAARGRRIGAMLVDRLVAEAGERGIRELYLLTTTAEKWFPRFGFHSIARSEVPEAVRESVEFREACPASAAAMVRRVAR